jgi:hypothetical protein
MSGQQQIPAWLAPWMLPLTGWPVQPGSASPGAEFNQPINPGWTFGNVVNVTEDNSSSPALERAIVAEESYGRQLGHVIEALVDLIGERPTSQPQSDAMQALCRLNEKIARVKAGRIDARVAEIQAFLADVRKSDAEQYARVADALRSALATGEISKA